MTISDYLARTVPQDCFEVLKESGYQFEEPRNTEELSLVLKKYIALDRDMALKKLAEIHPDKDLLQSLDREVKDYDYRGDATNAMMGHYFQNPFNKTPYRVGAPVMMNASGCGCGMSFNGYNDFCAGCGAMAFNGSNCKYMNCDGGQCKCGGKCGCGGGKMNADGGSQKKDYSPLYVAIGIFALAIYFAEVKNKH